MSLLVLHGFAGGPPLLDDALLHACGLPVVQPFIAGHGGVAAPSDFDAEVARLAALAIEAAPGPVHVIGYSLGGRIALRLVERYASRVASALILSAHPGLSDMKEADARRVEDAAWSRLLTDDPAAFFRAWDARPLFRRAADDYRRAARRDAHDPAELARALSRLGLGAMPQIDRAAIAGRLHVVLGADDARCVNSWRAGPAPAQLTVVADAAHDVIADAPAAVAAACRAYFATFRQREEVSSWT